MRTRCRSSQNQLGCSSSCETMCFKILILLSTVLHLQSTGAFRPAHLSSFIPSHSNHSEQSRSTSSSSHSIGSNRTDHFNRTDLSNLTDHLNGTDHSNGTNHSNDLCPDHWFRLDAWTCVHISKSKLNFEQSKNYCRLKFNANRLSLPNEAKQRAIASYLSSLSQSDQLNAPNVGHSETIKAWIGLNRVGRSDGDSVLFWDYELELYNKLPTSGKDKTIETNRQLADRLDRLKANPSHDHTKKGLIDLVDHHQAASEPTSKNEPSSSENETALSFNNMTSSVSQSYNVTAPPSESASFSSSNANAPNRALSSDERPVENSRARFESENSSNLTEKHLLAGRAILTFDNRFRINRVDAHFYISSGQADKWRMAFSPSNRLYTICELPLQRGKRNCCDDSDSQIRI